MDVDQDAIPKILQDCHTIGVVGLSSRPDRASYQVAHYMQQNGYRIIPVNPSYAGTYILDELCYSRLSEVNDALSKVGGQIDMVDCFRRSETILPIAEEAILIRARCLWLQLGVINDAAATLASAAGLAVVTDRCLKIEHMHWSTMRR